MISDAFPILQGVRQGAPISPLFYSIFINDLLHQLSIASLGSPLVLYIVDLLHMQMTCVCWLRLHLTFKLC